MFGLRNRSYTGAKASKCVLRAQLMCGASNSQHGQGKHKGEISLREGGQGLGKNGRETREAKQGKLPSCFDSSGTKAAIHCEQWIRNYIHVK